MSMEVVKSLKMVAVEGIPKEIVTLNPMFFHSNEA